MKMTAINNSGFNACPRFASMEMELSVGGGRGGGGGGRGECCLLATRALKRKGGETARALLGDA